MTITLPALLFSTRKLHDKKDTVKFSLHPFRWVESDNRKGYLSLGEKVTVVSLAILIGSAAFVESLILYSVFFKASVAVPIIIAGTAALISLYVFAQHFKTAAFIKKRDQEFVIFCQVAKDADVAQAIEKRVNQNLPITKTILNIALSSSLPLSTKKILELNPEWIKSYAHRFNSSALLQAVQARNVRCVESRERTKLSRLKTVEVVAEQMKKHQLHVDVPNKLNRTPFFTAMVNNDPEIAEYLFDEGTDPFHPLPEGKNRMEMFLKCGKTFWKLLENDDFIQLMKECYSDDAGKIDQAKKELNNYKNVLRSVLFCYMLEWECTADTRAHYLRKFVALLSSEGESWNRELVDVLKEYVNPEIAILLDQTCKQQNTTWFSSIIATQHP